jgi:chromosome segregation ATPase
VFQRIGFENELLKARERCSDMEAELKVKVTTLETEIRALEKARKQDQKAAENSMVGVTIVAVTVQSLHQTLHNTLHQIPLQRIPVLQQEEWLEKEIDLERRLSGLEGEVEKHKALVADKEGELAKLQHQLTLRDRHSAHTADRVSLGGGGE